MYRPGFEEMTIVSRADAARMLEEGMVACVHLNRACSHFEAMLPYKATTDIPVKKRKKQRLATYRQHGKHAADAIELDD